MSKSTSNAQLSDGEMAKNHTFAIGIKRDAKILKKVLNIPLHQAQQNLLDKAGFVNLSEMYQAISRRVKYYLQSSFFSFNKKDNSIRVGVHEINQDAFLDPENIIHIFTIGFDFKSQFNSLNTINISEYSPQKSNHVQYVVVSSLEELEKYSCIISAIAAQGRALNCRLLISLPDVADNYFPYQSLISNSNIIIAPKERLAALLGEGEMSHPPLSDYCPFVAYTLSLGSRPVPHIDYLLKA